MAGLGDIVQKAFYLGIGLAAAAGEQAGEKVILRGDVVTKETRNQLTLIGQEVEWQPKAEQVRVICKGKVQMQNLFQLLKY